jgi:hypothetical protein
VKLLYNFGTIFQKSSNIQEICGGGVWESNPPFIVPSIRGQPASTSPKDASATSAFSAFEFFAHF